MQKIIKRAKPRDYGFILALNEKNAKFLLPMDAAQPGFFADTAEVFNVLYADGVPAAFLIALRGGSADYDIRVYRWFSEHYARFLYIDRIVVDENHRGMGLGRRLYQDAFAFAKKEGFPLVAAAIETIPYNAQSLIFHKRMGFYEVGEQAVRSGTVKVSLQLAKVPGTMAEDA